MPTKKDKVLVKADENQALQTTDSNDFLELAKAGKVDVEMLKELIALKHAEDELQAKRAYVAAMNEFKADPPRIVKNAHVDYGEGNKRTQYAHASLDQVSDVIGKALSEQGLSHKWKTTQDKEITVECILTHVLGHSESVSLTASADTSGGKNGIQGIGSTITYLERYTLLAITGLAAGHDDDGRGSEGDDELISDKQLAEIEALAQEIKGFKLNSKRFLEYIGVESVEQTLACNYMAVIKTLETKRDEQ